MTIEYRLRPVTRFIVTRYESTENTGSTSTLGEYDNKDTAYDVGYALAKAEADRLQIPPGDAGVVFPERLVATGLSLHQAIGIQKIDENHGSFAPESEALSFLKGDQPVG